jgi:magnesium chelatase subunit H
MAGSAPVRVVFVTLDTHLAGAVERAERKLKGHGVTLGYHAASEWDRDTDALPRALDDIARADIVIATMLFMDDHINAVLPALQARRDHCDAMIGFMSGSEIVRLTRMGGYSMSKPASGMMAVLKKLKGSAKPGSGDSGGKQMRMLRRLPKILKFIPGTAQDLRAYFLTMQYWLAGSDDNVVQMVRALVDRYADGPRRELRGTMAAKAPAEYPEVGLYHSGRIFEELKDLPRAKGAAVGLLMLRSYILARDTAHYDGVIAALEAKGLRVIPAFASGLDARPAIERFFAGVDAVVNLTGFSLIGGPAYNDAAAAAETLKALDVPYIAAHPVEFQTLDQWRDGKQGLTPLEATLMVAIPELDGAIAPSVFGGRSEGAAVRAMSSDPERAAALAEKVAKLVALRRTPRAERKLGIVLFNFPPNAGAAGTAAFLGVWESLHATLQRLANEGYAVDVPIDADALREAVLEGNAARFGADANVHARINADDHVRREPHLKAIEAQWGPAPGKLQADSRSIHVLGAQFGNVFVGLQPAFGWEGDPMRLLFEAGFAPTHAFSAFYRWLRTDFGADAVLHFGTHGALEFMPGKQAGMSAACWPERLIGDLPNFYLYAANNPSEGLVAKRRAGATLISYLTPPLSHAGLYKGLADLKALVERWRGSQDDAERAALATMIRDQAAAVDLDAGDLGTLAARIYEVEQSLIPEGLHVLGRSPEGEALDRFLSVFPEAERADIADRLAANDELGALVHALDGRFVPPAPGGDLVANPDVLQSVRLRPLPHPERLRRRAGPRGRRPPARPPWRGAAGKRRDGAVGQRQPQERGRADRPGAGADRRAAPLRRLWPARGRRADSAGGTRPPADRCGDRAVRHLPRSPTPPDPDAGRSRLPRRHGRGARRAELRTEAHPRSPIGAGLRHRNRGAACLLERRGRLWRERQPADRRRRLDRSGRARRRVRAAQGLRLWPQRRGRPPARAVQGGAGPDRPYLPESRLGRARRHRHRSICGHAGRHRSRRHPRRRQDAAHLHRRRHARHGEGPHTWRAGGARNPHPCAQPALV